MIKRLSLVNNCSLLPAQAHTIMYLKTIFIRVNLNQK
jgi:hypothetical protein